MARTNRNQTYPRGAERTTWDKPKTGKYHKRQYHRAVRRAWKGTGKTKAIAHWASELNHKGT